MSKPDRVWWYSWPDGRAIVEQRGTCGVLWLCADLAVGRYAWSAWGGERPGADFRRWLLESVTHNPSYVVGKLCYGRPDIYDPEATDRAVRDLILRRRRDGDLDREAARDMWDSWVEDASYAGGAHAWLVERDVIDAHTFLRYERHGASDFERHLPYLAERLRADLAQSAEAEAA